MFCDKCGEQVPHNARFCPGCGAVQGEGAPKKVASMPCELQYCITGEILQTVEIEIPQGERVFSETGGMVWMDDTIDLETSIQKGTENKGVLDTLIKTASRVLQGESIFLNYYSASRGSGKIAFASSFPGKILAFNLKPEEAIIAQRGSFLVGQEEVDLAIEWRGLGAAIFGGEGLVLQRLTGPGLIFLEIDGELTERTLAPGQKLLVDTSHIACFEASVTYDIQLQKGIKNMFLGGEGLFLARLTGPGKVWIQHMTMPNLAGRIAPFLPFERNKSPKGFNLNLG